MLNSIRAREGPVLIASWSQVLLSATMIALGILGLIQRDFTPIWEPAPKVEPAHTILIYLSAIVFLICGVGLLWRRAAAVASRVLLGFLLAWLLLWDMPQLAFHPGIGPTWAACKTAVMVAAAWVLYVWFAGDRDGPRFRFATGAMGLRIARSLYGVALIPFGIAHFTYLERTAAMVPGWLPWHLAWAYFFGCTFIAAGLAIIAGVYARVAAILMVVQLAMFTVLVWVPVMAGKPSASDWSEFVVSWALTVAAWVVADSYGVAVREGFDSSPERAPLQT
jgi:uncharacterized membrane protein